jgi:hypothetical protein
MENKERKGGKRRTSWKETDGATQSDLQIPANSLFTLTHMAPD